MEDISVTDETAPTDQSNGSAPSDEAKGIDPAASPSPSAPTVEEHLALRSHVDFLRSELLRLGEATALILRHLDPQGTSHSFDALRED